MEFALIFLFAAARCITASLSAGPSAVDAALLGLAECGEVRH